MVTSRSIAIPLARNPAGSNPLRRIEVGKMPALGQGCCRSIALKILGKEKIGKSPC